MGRPKSAASVHTNVASSLALETLHDVIRTSIDSFGHHESPEKEHKDDFIGSEPRAWPGAIGSSMRRRPSFSDRESAK